MTAVTNKPAAAALNVYMKVAIIRKADDVLTYEDSEGTIKTITDLHLAAAVTVRSYNILLCRDPHGPKT